MDSAEDLDVVGVDESIELGKKYVPGINAYANRADSPIQSRMGTRD